MFPEVAAHGPTINAQLGAAGALNFGFTGDTFDEAHPMVVIGQTIAEAGDPIAYAKEMITAPAPLAGAATKPRNYLQIEAIYDELVANEGNEALARAAGFPMAVPNVGSNAGIADIVHIDANPQRITFPQAMPDAKGIHDVPMAGITAVLVQASPATHSDDLMSSYGNRNWEIPYNVTDPNQIAFRKLDAYKVKTPYRELHAVVTGFLDGAFAGAGAPSVTGLPTPIRDADGDGKTDDVDPNPNDPTK
jgi:hypothetical protein